MRAFEEAVASIKEGNIYSDRNNDFGVAGTTTGRRIDIGQSDSNCEEWIAPQSVHDMSKQHRKLFGSPLHNSRYD